MFETRGEYCDTGNEGTLGPMAGEPRPVIPETLKRLLPGGANAGRGGTGGAPDWSFCIWRLRAESDWRACSDGGVNEPLVGVLPLLRLPSLEVSVDFSVRKLALERRRNSLKFRKEGGMVVGSR
jgi:hypothetical protein